MAVRDAIFGEETICTRCETLGRDDARRSDSFVGLNGAVRESRTVVTGILANYPKPCT